MSCISLPCKTEGKGKAGEKYPRGLAFFANIGEYGRRWSSVTSFGNIVVFSIDLSMYWSVRITNPPGFWQREEAWDSKFPPPWQAFIPSTIWKHGSLSAHLSACQPQLRWEGWLAAILAWVDWVCPLYFTWVFTAGRTTWCFRVPYCFMVIEWRSGGAGLMHVGNVETRIMEIIDSVF